MKKPSAQIKPGNSYRFIQDKRCSFTAVVLLWYFLSAFVFPIPVCAGEIVAWGQNNAGQCNVPSPNTGFTAIAGGGAQSLGLKTDGSILAWGDNTWGECNVPSPNTNFIAVAAGNYMSLGLKSDGSIVAWGFHPYGDPRLTVPSPNTGFTAIAAGNGNMLGLKTDGSIVAWGDNGWRESDVPSPNTGFTAIAAGGYHSLGLKADGSIVAWGRDVYGECDVPSPNTGFVAIAAGWDHSLGLKTDGSIVAWGNNLDYWGNYSGQCDVPSPNTGFAAIAAGWSHSFGLKTDGSIVAWGYNAYGECNVPQPNTGFTAIAAGGGYFSLGLKCKCAPVAPVILSQPANQMVTVGGAATFSVTANGIEPLSYFWLRNSTPIPGANGTNYTLSNVQLSDSGSKFSCLVSNACGTALSSNAVLKVIETMANDLCSGAITISGAAYTNTQSTTKATSMGDPVPDCVTDFGNGVWYQFTPPAGGLMIVDTFGSDFDTGLAVYTGSCGSLTEAACNDDTDGVTSQITLPVAAGVTYYILAGGYSAHVGNLVLHLAFLTPPLITTQPTNQTVTAGSNVTFSVTASGTLPLSYQWSFNGTNLSGATNTMLMLTNVQVSQAGNYTVLVTNAFGSILSSNAMLTVTLDHFAWDSIPSPRFVNTPFVVTIRAQDLTNGLFTNFTGTAILGTTNGVAVAPSVSGNFVQGVWTGSVVISQTASNLVLQADDGLGHFGLANPINVVSLPSLEMLHSGNIALYMWPVGYSGFVLETSDSLSPATWVSIPYAPFQIGDQYLLPLEMTGTNGFYRLRFPGP